MAFDSFSDFLAMGGHGLYVWSAYGVSLVVIIMNVANPIIGHRRFFRTQKQNLRREEARQIEQE